MNARVCIVAGLLILSACTRACDRKEEWVWVPIDGVTCGNGSASGIGMLRSRHAQRLVVFFLGGGACFDAATCAPRCDDRRALCAANLDGFDARKFERNIDDVVEHSLFDLESDQNPFRADHFAFVPYCTGDFHSGSQRASSYGIAHVGHENTKIIARTLAANFPGVKSVVLYGVSAGGFGVLFEFETIASVFSDRVRFDLIDDSGPPLSPEFMPIQKTMRAAWASSNSAPKDCPKCADDWSAFLPYLAAKYPRVRFALISPLDDLVIRRAFAGPIREPANFRQAMEKYAEELSSWNNVRVFYHSQPGHVFARFPLDDIVEGDTNLGAFIRAQLSDDESWKNVRGK